MPSQQLREQAKPIEIGRHGGSNYQRLFAPGKQTGRNFGQQPPRKKMCNGTHGLGINISFREIEQPRQPEIQTQQHYRQRPITDIKDKMNLFLNLQTKESYRRLLVIGLSICPLKYKMKCALLCTSFEASV